MVKNISKLNISIKKKKEILNLDYSKHLSIIDSD